MGLDGPIEGVPKDLPPRESTCTHWGHIERDVIGSARFDSIKRGGKFRRHKFKIFEENL